MEKLLFWKRQLWISYNLIPIWTWITVHASEVQKFRVTIQCRLRFHLHKQLVHVPEERKSVFYSELKIESISLIIVTTQLIFSIYPRFNWIYSKPAWTSLKTGALRPKHSDVIVKNGREGGWFLFTLIKGLNYSDHKSQETWPNYSRFALRFQFQKQHSANVYVQRE